SASLDGSVRLWDAASGKELRKIPYLVIQSRFPWFGGTLAFSPDDTMLALARDGLGVWDTTTGQEIRRFGALPDNTLALQFGADERILLVSGSDETLVLRDLATQKVAFQHKSAGRIGFAAVAPDGKYLALADTDNKGREYFRVLDAGTGKELPALSQ